MTARNDTMCRWLPYVLLCLLCAHTADCAEQQLPIKEVIVANEKGMIKSYPFRGNEAILDIGCGSGAISSLLASEVKKGSVKGIDISGALIELAQTKYKATHNNLHFEKKDVREIQYVNSYDLVTSFSVLHWVPEQKDVLMNLGRALKTDGVLWIQIPLGLPSALTHALQKVTSQEKWRSYFLSFQTPWKFYSPAEYQDLLSDVKLKPISMTIITKEDTYDSSDKFKLFLKQWLPYLKTLPDHEQDLFLNELADAYLEHAPLDTQGKVKFVVQKIDVKAKRK